MSSIFALWASVVLGAGGPVTGLSIAPAAERTEVLIAVDGDVEFRDFTMEGPSRLVVDLFGARHALPRDDFLDVHRGGVTSIRTSQYSEDVVRVVLELTETVPYEVVPGEGGLHVLLSSAAGPFEPWSSRSTPPSPGPDGSSSATAAPAAASGAPGAAALPSDGDAAEAPALQPLTAFRPPQQQEAQHIDFTFINTPIEEVLLTFAEASGRSIVAGNDVQGFITATIDDQPWDEALQTILMANGFRALELESGIIRVDNLQTLNQQETFEPVFTRAYKINYATAAEVAQALQGVVSQARGGVGGGGGGGGGQGNRGTITVGESTNTVIVTDIQRVHDQVEELITQLDRRSAQVAIEAKIVFVNRTDLNEFGVTYDLKDSQGNQLNVLTPGAVDQNGDGVIELPDEQVEVGTNVVSLGGNSVAALGNANNRVVGPTLTLLSSLLVGRHTLLAFVEALESLNLSDIQAVPSLTVADNNTARIQVGEQTPLRVVDASAGGAGAAGGAAGGGGAALPTATVQIQETGIILEATPHVTSTNNILLDLRAERSAPRIAESDVGFIFDTQNAQTRVLLENGETVVIAGLTVTEQSEIRSGIPLLMNLPLVGRLFRVTRSSQVQRDLIILVTPHIVGAD